ncbi:ABC transporter permease [Massilia sp. W12]|uniref:ABC transporter permease n=1 Tax=Massilia sp. W12 TaxID=3126507 RepID=UPI0030CDA3DD
MIALQLRASPSPHWRWLSPLLALAVTAAVGALLLFLLGKPVAQGLAVFFWEPLKNLRGVAELGLKMAPLLLCALGLSLCFRANVFNIGAEGQLLAGAMTAAALALHLDGQGLPSALALALSLAAGMAGGMLWAGLTAFLRDWGRANEILVSLMLVYVAQLLLGWLVNGPLRDPAGYNFPQSKMLSDALLLPVLGGSRLHPGILFALLAAILVWLALFKTWLGFRWQVGGLAPQAAKFAGFSARASLWQVMLLSGALAGLAGACEVLGPVGQLNAAISPGYGFSAIIVAWVARLHPLGCVLASALLALFYLGGELAQLRLGLPNAISAVFQGVLLCALLACDSLIRYEIVWRSRVKGA